MNSTGVELSICIPTRNRAHLLDVSLKTLLPQCSGRPVEVCVSDNASTDGTAALLAGSPAVRFETREQDVGIDRNIIAALRMARGRYVLPIGDDETFHADGIDCILSALRDAPDMLMLKGRCKKPVTDLREAFRLFWDQMPLGGFAIHREYADPVFTDRYLGTYHAYSGAAWDYLLAQPAVRIDCTPRPVVRFSDVPKSWSADSARIISEEIPRWFDLIPAYYADAVFVSFLKYKRTWGRSAGNRA